MTASFGSLVLFLERDNFRLAEEREDFRCLRLAMARDCTPIVGRIESDLDYDKSQLLRAYSMTGDFLAAKRRYDPPEVFYNEFYARFAN